jgi:hypothetical protein
MGFEKCSKSVTYYLNGPGLNICVVDFSATFSPDITVSTQTVRKGKLNKCWLNKDLRILRKACLPFSCTK